ncbi:cell division protein CrgA [Prauserella oleivorans]|uniref:Cell division protein CrgA n=1 Tax=Prauserella oleivorans TaxID=1478153 RepID=A0ABW5WEC5_9PSEU
MPKSRTRKKTAYTPPPNRRTPAKPRAAGPSHPIYKGVMFGLMLLGLGWMAVFYIAGDEIEFMFELGNWNFVVAFVFGVTGLLMTLRWR